MNLENKIKAFSRQENLFNPGDKILMGISGGMDSVALTHIMSKLKGGLGLRLHMAHFNHKLRKKADTDQKFVEELSKKLNIPLFTENWKSSKNHKKSSVEELARNARLRFFNRIAKKISADSVVLAHTQNDQAETVLMRILRGSGLQGLKAICPKRKLNGVVFVRPFLCCTRLEINQYIKTHKLSYREDETNQKKIFMRNKIRLDLIPLLEKDYNPKILNGLNQLAEHIRIDYDFLESSAEILFNKICKISKDKKKVQMPLTAMLKQHPAMQRMLFRTAFERLAGSTSRLTLTHWQHMEQLINRDPMSSVISFPYHISACKSAKSLIFVKQ